MNRKDEGLDRWPRSGGFATAPPGQTRRMPGDKGSLVVATLFCLGAIVYGIATGSLGLAVVGLLGFLIGGLVLKLLG